jgi:hypothetical protein
MEGPRDVSRKPLVTAGWAGVSPLCVHYTSEPPWLAPSVCVWFSCAPERVTWPLGSLLCCSVLFSCGFQLTFKNFPVCFNKKLLEKMRPKSNASFENFTWRLSTLHVWVYFGVLSPVVLGRAVTFTSQRHVNGRVLVWGGFCFLKPNTIGTVLTIDWRRKAAKRRGDNVQWKFVNATSCCVDVVPGVKRENWRDSRVIQNMEELAVYTR